MSEHGVEVIWERNDAPWHEGRYSRAHRWRFDGCEIAASSSPQVVPLPMSDPHAVDPEEALAASVASCHMLWFLHLAARRGLVVDAYRDHAFARMREDPDGGRSVGVIVLRPQAVFAADTPADAVVVRTLHAQAHAQCYIARSLKSEVRCEPVLD